MRRPLLVLIMALLAQICFSQQAAENAGVQRRLLVSLEASPESGYTAQETAVLQKSLALALREKAGRIRIIEYGKPGFPQTTESRSSEAARTGADCWLCVGISGGRDAPTIHAQSFDMVSGTMVIDRSFARAQALASLAASREHWQEILPLVAAKYQPGNAAELSKNERRTVKLVIHALPDTRITGLPGGPLVSGRYGVVTVSLDAPSSYRLRASLSGYHPVEKDVYVDADSEIRVDQQHGTRWTAEGSFFNALFLGGDAGFFFLPDTAFVKVGVTSFLLGLAFSQTSLTYSFPLVHVNVQVGSYWLPEDAGLRLYTAAGGFLRVVFPGHPTRIDALSPGGFQLNLGSEIPISGASRFFLEWIPMLYLSGLPDLFIDSLGPGGVPFGYVPLDIGAINFMNLRFGVRWML